MSNILTLRKSKIEESSTPSNEVGLNAFSLTKKKATLKERIDEHKVGSPFMYITVDKRDERTLRGLYDKMLGFKTTVRSERVPVEELPVMMLTETFTKIPLKFALPKKSSIPKDLCFLNLYECMVVFRPTQGFFQLAGDIEIRIEDDRLLNDNVVRSKKLSSNSSDTFYLSLDYSVHVHDISDINFIVECQSTNMKKGKVWASLRIQVTCHYHTEAKAATLIPVLGMTSIDQSVLETGRFNPLSHDSRIDDATFSSVKHMYKRGELRDLTEPKERQKLEAFEGSVAGSSIHFSDGDNSDSGSVLEKLKQAKINEERNKIETGKVEDLFDSSKILNIDGEKKDKKKKKKVVIFESDNESSKDEKDDDKFEESSFDADRVSHSRFYHVLKRLSDKFELSKQSVSPQEVINIVEIANKYPKVLEHTIHMSLDSSPIISVKPFFGSVPVTVNELFSDYATTIFSAV